MDGTLPPSDVKIGWRSLGVYGARIAMMSEILSDIIVEEMEKRDLDVDVVLGSRSMAFPSPPSCRTCWTPNLPYTSHRSTAARPEAQSAETTPPSRARRLSSSTTSCPLEPRRKRP